MVVQQSRSYRVFTTCVYFRIDLLESIRDRIALEPYAHRASIASSWIEKAIDAASSNQDDWIVEFFLRLALGALIGKRYAIDILTEIKFAMLEFRE